MSKFDSYLDQARKKSFGKKELTETGDLVLTNKEKMQQLTTSIADTSVKIGLIFLPMLDKLLNKILQY